MTNTLLLSFTLVACAFGQTVPVAVPVTPAATSAAVPTTNTPAVMDGSALPTFTAGIGPTWLRGSANPFAVDVVIGYRPTKYAIYWWTDISTPAAMPNPGTGPTVSTLTTGSAYIPTQSKSGRWKLIFLGQAGITQSTDTTTGIPAPGAAPVTIQTTKTSPAFSGSFGLAVQPLMRYQIWLFPFIKMSNVSTSNTGGALATGILQMGVQFIGGFGAKQ